MPLTKKGKKIMSKMKKQYGKKKGKKVFYASENKGSIKGIAKKGKKVMKTGRKIKKAGKKIAKGAKMLSKMFGI